MNDNIELNSTAEMIMLQQAYQDVTVGTAIPTMANKQRSEIALNGTYYCGQLYDTLWGTLLFLNKYSLYKAYRAY